MFAFIHSIRILQRWTIHQVISHQALLVTLMASLMMSACSEDKGPMLLVEVSLAGGAQAPEKVHLNVSQAGKSVKDTEFMWPSTNLLKAGVRLPKGTTGAVSVHAEGIRKGGVVVEGTKEGTVGGVPIAIQLNIKSGSADGGTEMDGPAADMSPSDLRPVDAGSIDRLGDMGGLAVEVGPDVVTPDLAIVEVLVAPDAGPDVAPDATPDLSPDTGPDAPMRSWAEAVMVLTTQDNFSPPAVAVVPASGDALVVRADKTMGVQAIHYNAGTNTWGSPVVVSNRSGVQEAKVAVDGNGRYVVVWSQLYDATPAVSKGVWASFSSDGVSWSATPVLVYDGTARSLDTDIMIAMNRSGQARVVWDHFVSSPDQGDHHKMVSVFLSGTTLSPAIEVADCISDCAPRVAIDGSGRGLMLWHQPDPMQNIASVWAAPFTAQNVSTAALIENGEAATTDLSAVAMNDAGQGIAVWQQRNNLAGIISLDVQARRYSVTNGWLEPDAVGRFSGAGEMSVVLDSMGTAHLAFSQLTAQRFQAMFAWQSVGGTWTTLPMETDNKAPNLTNRTGIEPRLALGPSGSLLMGWRKKLTDNEFAPHLRWRRDNVWGPETEVGMIPDMFSSVLGFGIADNGNAVAVWTYSHCAPGSDSFEKVCPTAKTWDEMSQISQAARGATYVSIYR
jgi:hypothetical protein